MNDRSILQPPAPEPRGTWLDTYLPENQIEQYQERPKLIDTSAIRGIIYRQRWLAAAVLVLAMAGGLAVTLMATPMYEARATVLVNPQGQYIVEGQDGTVPSIEGRSVTAYLATQVVVIKSRNMANRVAEKLNLGERYDFLGQQIDERRPPNHSDDQWLLEKQKMAANRLPGGVNVILPRQERILTITYSSEDPVLAAELANAYAEAFTESDTRTNLENNEYAQEYLQDQIAAVRSRLEDAEQSANAYARDSSIIVQQQAGEGGESAVTLTNTNLIDINQRVAAARATRIETEQRWRSVQNVPAGQLSEGQSSATLQGLARERTSLQGKLVELRQRYNDEFPEIVNIKNQIALLDQQIGQQGAQIKATLRNAFVVARNQEQALERELASVTGETLVEQDRRVEYNVLEREAQALRDQLKALLDRYNDISTAAEVDAGRLTKLDLATVPGSPYEPDLTKNMLLALVFGVAIAGGLAVLRETFDDRIHSLDDVEDKVGLPLLGHTPFVESRDLEQEGTNRFSALMEAYASIRSAIDFTLPRSQNVIQLTSSQASEGKSTTAVILAELFASLGRKTLLIDADLRRPSIARLLDIESPDAGLVEVVLGHTDLQSALVKGLHENLEILPVGAISPNPTEVLASTQMRQFIEDRRQDYSLIIIDSSPVMGLADAPLLAGAVDGTIFVLEANRVHFGQAKAAIRRVRRAGGNLLGVILTKYRALESGQSYDYQYGYYQYGNDK